MAVEFFVFWLNSHQPDNAKLRIGELEENCKKERLEIRFRNSDSPGIAPWTGSPFILVGSEEDVKCYLNTLPPESRHVLNDCAYYWILSNSDQNSFSSEAAVMGNDRIVVLNWDYNQHYVVQSRLIDLLKYPRLIGLSYGLSRIRSEIERISVGRKGPWTPTLILGDSGTGKEEVALTLYDSIDHKGSAKDKNKFTIVACGYLTEELLHGQLFGHVKGAYTGAIETRNGILQKNDDGGVLLNDLDTAPLMIQGLLLGVINTPKNQEAIIYKLGSEVEDKTLAWLIFTTNANIVELLEEKKLREDFIFRFGDRIIHVPPLRDRPADIPAIAHHIWNELWKEDENRKKPLSPLAFQFLFNSKTRWEGNVRALQALLSLASSMANLTAHNQHSMRQILGEIMARGDEYRNWVGIVVTPSFTGPISTEDPVVRLILDLDKNAESVHRSAHTLEDQTPEPPWPTAMSENEAAWRHLTLPNGIGQFREFLKNSKVTKSRKKVRTSVRLSRAICYVARQKKINRHIYAELSGLGGTTASRELDALTNYGFLHKVPGKSQQIAEYTPEPAKVGQGVIPLLVDSLKVGESDLAASLNRQDPKVINEIKKLGLDENDHKKLCEYLR